MIFRNTLLLVLLPVFLLFGSTTYCDLASSGWGSYGKRQAQGESFKLPFEIEVNGNYADGKVVLEGTTHIQDSKLTRYFKKQQQENQTGFSSDTEDNEFSDSDSFDAGGYISLLDGRFKLLQLVPMAGTSKTTVEIYFGEDPLTPALEAIEVRLNPFKKSRFEIVLSSLNEVDFRNVKAVVTLDTGVSDEHEDATFTAELSGHFVLGDSDSFPDAFDNEPSLESGSRGGSSF